MLPDEKQRVLAEAAGSDVTQQVIGVYKSYTGAIQQIHQLQIQVDRWKGKQKML